jgi:hypothetical protein
MTERAYIIYCLACNNTKEKKSNHCISCGISIACRKCCTCAACIEWQRENPAIMKQAKKRAEKIAKAREEDGLDD